MPSINEQFPYAGDSKSNFEAFELSIEIHNKRKGESSARGIRREYINNYIPTLLNDNTYREELEFKIITAFVSNQIRYFGGQEDLRIYPVDFLEGSGSYILTMKLIVECFIAYHHLYEALERVAQKLEGSLTNDDFYVRARISTSTNFQRPIRATPLQTSAASSIRFIQGNLIGIIALIGVGIIWLGSRKEQEKSVFPEKIEVLIHQDNTPPSRIDSSHLHKEPSRKRPEG